MGNYLVTGANGGMGAAVCRLLHKIGHSVWGIDRVVSEEEVPWHRIVADTTQTPDLKSAFEQVRAGAQTLDGIVHTAGIYDLNALLEMPEADFLRDFDVNLFGVFRVNQVFAPILKADGRIVIVSSELAPLYPLPFTGVYAATKTALEAYAAALRMEVQLVGQSVIVVRPGAVRTKMLPASTDKLERFCASTMRYRPNAARFRRIVNAVEARSVPPETVARVIARALTVKRPRLVCCVNRNPLLLLLNALPKRLQLMIIRAILS